MFVIFKTSNKDFVLNNYELHVQINFYFITYSLNPDRATFISTNQRELLSYKRIPYVNDFYEQYYKI